MSVATILEARSPAARRLILPLALAQFICSFAGSNMNVMITDISADLDTTVHGVQTVITVFLGVNDLRTGVTPVEFGAQLRALLSDLRADSAPTVLVANVPPLDRLPAYLACRPNPPPGGPPCSTAGALPPPDELNARVAAYDRAVADAAAATGAALVDLHRLGLTARADGTEASTVSSDGFHPNARGHALIARAFAGAYRRVAPPVSP